MQERQNAQTNRSLILAVLAGILLVAAVVFVIQSPQVRASGSPLIPDSSPERGQRLLVEHGCGGCHTVPGVREARGLVGPPLNYWADRHYIAGRVPNTPENLVSWIMSPQSMVPGSAMPDMNITWGDARDIAAYLYTLRDDRR